MSHSREILVVTIFLLLAAVASSRLPHLESDNAFERWIDPASPTAVVYRDFVESFPTEQFILLSVTSRSTFDPTTFDRLVALVSEIETLGSVDRVASLPTLFRDVFGGEDLEALIEEISATPFYDRLMVSTDRETLGIFIYLAPATTAAQRNQLVMEIERLAADSGIEAALVGPPVLNAALDRISTREMRDSLPLAVVLSTLALLLFFRAIRPVIVALVCSATTLVLTLATAELLGWKLSMVSTALPPLIWVLSLSASIHLLAAYRRLRHELDPHAAIWRAVAEVVRPCTLSSATTAIGLLSLTSSGFRPIREFGVLAGAGLLVGVIVTFGLGRALLVLLDSSASNSLDGHASRVAGRLAHAAVEHRTPMLVIYALALAAGLAVLPRLSADSNPLRFLASEEPVVVAYHQTGERLTGMSPLEVLITDVSLDDADDRAAIDALALHLGNEPGVAKLISPIDVMRKMNQWHHDLAPSAYVVPSHEDLPAVIAEADPMLRTELHALANAERRHVRLSALVTPLESSSYLALADRFDALAADSAVAGRATTTGTVLQLVQAQRQLVTSQLRSLAIALLLVFASISVGLRSLRMTLLSVAPNLVPVMAVFTFMAAVGLPLDPGTVMVAGIALGIAVDDSVHLLTAVRRARLDGHAPLEAVTMAAEALGPALFITTFGVTAGFLALLGSPFLPIHYFAVLSTLAMLVALAADLTLLPALLHSYKPRPRPG